MQIMKSATASKSKPSAKPTEPLGRFITIKNRRVIHETDELLEAMTKRNESPNGVSIYGRVASDQQHPPKVRDDEPKRNPMADAMETLSHDVEINIADTFSEMIGGRSSITDGVDSSGLIHSRTLGEEPRPATNEECATWFADIALEAKFDRRKKLPPQVAKWLRKQAAAFIKAAESIEVLDDDRNMAVIRKLIADDTYLPSVIARHQQFEYDGTLSPDPVAEYRATHAEEFAS
jgi:hypothetical protein